MGMSREDRRPSDELADFALKEYERLQQEALPLRPADVKLYKKTFTKSLSAMPDNCRDDLSIAIYGRKSEISEDVI